MVKGFESAEQNLAHHWAAQEELGWVGKCLLTGESKGHSATQLIWFVSSEQIGSWDLASTK